jgi:zinc protease
VNVLISIRAGHRYEPKEKSGLAQLLATMLNRSTTKTSKEEVENKLDRLGSSMNISSGEEEISISVQALKKNLKATMDILAESFFEPKFDNAEFELEKKKQLDGIVQMQSNASALADLAYRKVLYGREHVMGLPPAGTAESVGMITVEDVKEYYKSLNASMVSVAVSGDATKDEVLANMDFLLKLKPGKPLKPDESSPSSSRKTRIYFVDKKGAAQSEIRIGYIAMPYDAFGDYYKNTIMNFSFGGAFNSRINFLLRESKGWTYGVRGGFSGTRFPGPYTISGGFKSNTTDSTIVELFSELKKYNNHGVTDQELEFTRNAMVQSDALKYESPMQKLGFIKRVLEYGLPKDYVAKQMEILKNITRNEVNNLAKRYLPSDRMSIVIVGDKASNFEKLKNLGYDVVEMDAAGNALN